MRRSNSLKHVCISTYILASLLVAGTAKGQDVDPLHVYRCPDGSYTNMLSVAHEKNCQQVPDAKMSAPPEISGEPNRKGGQNTLRDKTKRPTEDTNSHSRWKIFGQTGFTTVYILNKSPERYGGGEFGLLVRQWFLYDNTKKRNSFIIFDAIDCKSKRIATLQVIKYSKPMGGGTVVAQFALPDGVPPEYQYAVPGSIGDQEVQQLCINLR